MLTKIVAVLFAVFYTLTGSPLSKYDYSDKVGGEYEGLRTYYEDYFDVGAAVGAWYTRSAAISANLLKNYTSLTGENDFKLPVIHPADGVWNFTGADAIADFCRNNNLKLRGHCLLWGNEQNWMLFEEDGETFTTKEIFYERLYDHMKTIMERYGDVIHTWDVVNEPFGYDRSSAFKKSAVYRLCGEEYVTKAFEIAHEIDPTACLVLNETGVTRNNVKTKYLFSYLEKWLAAGVPIHAVGLQGHWALLNPSETPRRMEKVIRRLSDMGLDVQITEVDINVYITENATIDKPFEELPVFIERIQNKRYLDWFAMLRRNADKISSVTFWGVSDHLSFYNNPGKKLNWPLLFDQKEQPKQCFFAITDF